MKRLIVIDGVDGSGKETQVKLLANLIAEKGICENVRTISFPDYKSPSSALVKMYLNGDLASDAADVNAFAASSFYAVDRYASYKMDWGQDFYTSDGIIIADRYTTSNIVHQVAKIDDKQEKIEAIKWICDMEYKRLGIPEPERVIFLDMPPWAAAKLREGRNNKITGGEKQDIHESNDEFMKKSYDNALFVANYLSWDIVRCTYGMNIKSIEEISREVAAVLSM